MDERLKDIDTDSLLVEIERRKIKKPITIQNFAYDSLRVICESHLDNIGEDENDFKEKIYRAAMEMWFGGNVWEYISKIKASG